MDLPKSMYQMSDVLRYNGFFEGMKDDEVSDKTAGYRARYAFGYATGFAEGGIDAYLDIFAERIKADMEKKHITLEEALQIHNQPLDRKELFEAIFEKKCERLHLWGGGSIEIKEIWGYFERKGKKITGSEET